MAQTIQDISGQQLSTPLAYFDPDTCSLKTSQGTFLLDSTKSSLTLPRSGSMRSGVVYGRPTSALVTDVSACLSLLPTPTAYLGQNGGSQHPDKRRAGGHQPSLQDVVEHLLPTPTVGDSKSARNSTAKRTKIPPTGVHAGDTLTDWVTKYAHAWGKYAPAIARWSSIFGEPPSATDSNSRLSPDFVTWMMNLEPGWVDGIKRTQQLKCLGNAVVPSQAMLAWRLLGGPS